MTHFATSLIAVDIGNSRMKLGRFAAVSAASGSLPEPADSFDLAIRHATGEFSVEHFAAWCQEHVGDAAQWRIASVHRAATERLRVVAAELAKAPDRKWKLQHVTYRDVPLVLDVEMPERVGIDRLLAAAAANRLRQPEHIAVVADVGTAITVDLVDERGIFRGGAILPGIAMAARALEAETDALPRVQLDHLAHPPAALGKATVPAIESGLYWGAVGAIRELIHRLTKPHTAPPDVFLTGGASTHVMDVLAEGETWSVRHVPHLVLAGIALVES